VGRSVAGASMPPLLSPCFPQPARRINPIEKLLSIVKHTNHFGP
jgi:hypothetical protein